MQPAGERATDGFAAVDAMVALLILSVTIVFSLEAVQTAKRAATAAEETRRATALLRYLVDSAPDAVSQQSGRANGFGWRVDVRAGAPSGVPMAVVCEQTADLVSEKTGRRFRLATAVICPPRQAS
jgi:Tfp pilus assembly protein PilV